MILPPKPGPKQLAMHAVSKAVREGLIKRQPCIICGNPKTVGHHEDYNKQLDIIWLCSKHHSRLHSLKKAGKSINDLIRANATETEERQFIRLYNSGRSWRYLSKYFNVSKGTISNWLRTRFFLAKSDYNKLLRRYEKTNDC
jgi:hypothetical protein